jgi:hypothetical protein
MNREEKILMAIDKGYTCNPETGEVFGMKGAPIGKIDDRKRCIFAFNYNKKNYHLLFHQFVWYWVNKEVVECLDHIDRNPSNNKISNLRSITHQKNLFNRTLKGYTKVKRIKKDKFKVGITFDGKYNHIGLYDTEEEARQAYLEAKKIYHII